MSEKELARAIQDVIAAQNRTVPDARQVVEEFTRRQQRRVRCLAGLSVLFWLLAVAGLILLVVGLDRFVIFVRVSDFPATQERSPLTETKHVPTQAMLHGTSLLHHSIALIGGSVLALLLAALCTIVLIFTSRRATLHQIQLSLLALSEQLEELRRPPASDGGGEAGSGLAH
jgi:hypothetical protein